MTIKIIPITNKMISQVADAYIDATKENGWEWGTQGVYAKDFIKYKMSVNPKVAVAATDGGRIMGAGIGWVAPWWSGNELNNITFFIRPEYQRKINVFVPLLVKFLEIAQQKYNCKNAEAVATLTASKIYKKFGFNVSEDFSLLATSNFDSVLNNLRKWQR